MVATCYLLGVSTRRMDKLVQSLGITGLSKSQVSRDGPGPRRARRGVPHPPARTPARSRSWPPTRWCSRSAKAAGSSPVHALVATGVNADGHREILGVQVTTGEDGAGWLAFFRDLTARGLSGVRLVTSDAHAGLVDAIGATLPGASWQRCRTHYAANLMSVTPKTSWGWVKALLHIDLRPARRRRRARPVRPGPRRPGRQAPRGRRAPRDRPRRHPRVHRFPKEIWRQIWSNNPNERLNREIRRRTDVVGIFPDRASIIRLVGAVLAEQHDEWAEGRRYLGLDVLARSQAVTTTTDRGGDQRPTLQALTA